MKRPDENENENENDQNDQENLNEFGEKRLNEKFFNQVPNILLNDVRDGTLIPSDVIVYLVLLNYTGVKDYVWPSLETVGRLIGQSSKNVGRCLNRLEEAGHILRKGKTKWGTRCTFVLTRVEGSRVKRGKKGHLTTGDAPKRETAIPVGTLTTDNSNGGQSPGNSGFTPLEEAMITHPKRWNSNFYERRNKPLEAEFDELADSDDVPF